MPLEHHKRSQLLLKLNASQSILLFNSLAFPGLFFIEINHICTKEILKANIWMTRYSSILCKRRWVDIGRDIVGEKALLGPTFKPATFRLCAFLYLVEPRVKWPPFRKFSPKAANNSAGLFHKLSLSYYATCWKGTHRIFYWSKSPTELGLSKKSSKNDHQFFRDPWNVPQNTIKGVGASPPSWRHVTEVSSEPLLDRCTR